MFQQVNLVPFLTARENLLVVRELARVHRGGSDRAGTLLDELGLADRTAQPPRRALRW